MTTGKLFEAALGVEAPWYVAGTDFDAATWEIITAMAFAPEPGQPRRAREGGEIASFDVAKLRGSRVRRDD